MPDVQFNGKPGRSGMEIRRLLKTIHQQVEPATAGPFATGLPAEYRRIIRDDVDKALAEHEEEVIVADLACGEVETPVHEERRKIVGRALMAGGFGGLVFGSVFVVAFVCLCVIIALLPISDPGIVQGLTLICIALAILIAVNRADDIVEKIGGGKCARQADFEDYADPDFFKSTSKQSCPK